MTPLSQNRPAAYTLSEDIVNPRTTVDPPLTDSKWVPKATSPRESVDSRPDGRSMRLDLVCYSRAFPVVGGLQAEILVLRHQLNVLRRRSPKQVAVSNFDRLVFIGLYRLAPKVLDALKILQPVTVFRANIRRLLLEMSVANPLRGAPRIHGELLKLGIDVGQTTVAKYMA
jgi:hypothetical protein